MFLKLKFIFFFAITFLFSAEKIDFWKVQRKGANSFNLKVDEAYFKEVKKVGIEWVRLAYDKWPTNSKDFLMGNADYFKSLVKKDLRKLIKVLNLADKYSIKIVVVPLSLPGIRWKQNNKNKYDDRLWKDKKYWQQAIIFWQQLALALKNHPAIYAYNIKNEPTPEKTAGLEETASPAQYKKWYKKHKSSSRDLLLFYREMIDAIRKVDQTTPIMLSSGWYAAPNAFAYWSDILKDDSILYSFHMYTPYAYTSRHNFKRKVKLNYPGEIPYAGKTEPWDKQRIESFLDPLLQWSKTYNIPAHQIVVGEFGCYRRNLGCEKYLEDIISIFNSNKFHWAFYSFREDNWDGYDYELGTKPVGWQYWKDIDKGITPKPNRKNNPLFNVLSKEFR